MIEDTERLKPRQINEMMRGKTAKTIFCRMLCVDENIRKIETNIPISAKKPTWFFEPNNPLKEKLPVWNVHISTKKTPKEIPLRKSLNDSRLDMMMEHNIIDRY